MTSLEAPPILMSNGEELHVGNNYEEEEDSGEILPAPISWFDDDSIKNDCNVRTTGRASVSPPDAYDEFDSDLDSVAGEIQEEYEQEPQERPVTPPLRMNSAPSRSSAGNSSSRTVLGEPLPSPSWKEISSQVLPCAARELLSSSLQRIYHTARLGYARGRWQRKYTELGNNSGGYYVPSGGTNDTNSNSNNNSVQLPPFSSLPWIDRQMVEEWRTWGEDPQSEDDEEVDFDRARTLVPTPALRPQWRKAEACFACHKTFGPTRLRHHCRLCGESFCQAHSSERHALQHLGYEPDVPERVCDGCKRLLLDHNLAERVAWRLARCRDHYVQGNLTPYFETGVDTVEKMALRITQAALAMARSIPLGAQATVAVETVDVLRKYGLNGIYTIMLRQEFLAAADLLSKALGINRTAWPLSVHELSAAIFYALAQHRAVRGLNPDGEHLIHTFKKSRADVVVDETVLETDLEGTEKLYSGQGAGRISDLVSTAPDDTSSETSSLLANLDTENDTSNGTQFQPVCDPVPDEVVQSLIFYAPLALNFVYAEKEVDMQLLAAQQGWRLLYAHLDHLGRVHPGHDLPASALFVHDEHKILCLSIRGTTTISDVVTDLRQVAVSFPDSDAEPAATAAAKTTTSAEDEWTSVRGGQGIAVCGMSQAAVNLYRENIDSIMFYANRGYRIRVVGHSLGGGVSALLGILIHRDLAERSRKGGGALEENSMETEEKAALRVYAYGSPSCVDKTLSKFVESFVVTVVLHDDVVPRLTPTSCRGLLKYLLHIRETWVKDHLPDDIMAIKDRAKTVWAPRWRGSFTLPTSSSSLKRTVRKHIQYGKKTFRSVREKIVGDDEDRQLFSIAETDGSQGSEKPMRPTGDDPTRQQSEGEVSQSLVLDYMGGLDVTAAVGLIIEGDEFFDAGSSLLEENEEDSPDRNDDYDHKVVTVETKRSHRSPMEVPTGGDGATKDDLEETNDEEETPGAVVLDETPLHRMYLPGKIIHIYSHRGVYKAAYVPRDFRELRRISPAGNMLTDHKCKPYYEALLELRTVRRAAEAPPRWVSFDCDDTCSCCASKFTWASTSDSKAQEARDKHNCRSCGTLVCDPCSRNRVPLPSIGLTVPSRVCDRCYNDVDGVLTGNGGPTATESNNNVSSCSVDAKHNDHHQGPHNHDELFDNAGGLPVRQRVRRSPVVDDLAARVQTAPMTCT